MSPADAFAALQTADLTTKTGRPCKSHIRRIIRNVVRKSSAIFDQIDILDDLMQDTWVKAWKACEAGQEVNLHWLFKVAKNTAWDYRDKIQHERGIVIRSTDDPVEDVDGDTAGFLETHVDLEDRGMDDDRRHRLFEAMKNLPEWMPEVIILHYYEDLQVKAIAERLGITVSTAKKRLQLARDAIRTVIGAHDAQEILVA
jgi:RNA polymerase sigma-70 factor (ECF subfamily)